MFKYVNKTHLSVEDHVSIIGCMFQGIGDETNGGAIFVSDISYTNIKRCLVVSCHSNNGGAIYGSSSIIQIFSTCIEDCFDSKQNDEETGHAIKFYSTVLVADLIGINMCPKSDTNTKESTITSVLSRFTLSCANITQCICQRGEITISMTQKNGISKLRYINVAKNKNHNFLGSIDTTVEDSNFLDNILTTNYFNLRDGYTNIINCFLFGNSAIEDYGKIVYINCSGDYSAGTRATLNMHTQYRQNTIISKENCWIVENQFFSECFRMTYFHISLALASFFSKF